MKKLIRGVIKLCVASAVLSAVIYASSESFSRRWREFIIGQMAERGLHMDLKRLMLNPFGGLIARDVKVFTGADRLHVLASVDELNLDFDYGKLLEKMFVVDGLELSHASVSLPVDDPEGGEHTVITLEDLSARAFLREGVLEVRQAQGTLSGIRLNITGLLTLPGKKVDEPPKAKVDSLSVSEQIKVINAHHRRIQRGVEWLNRFEFDTPPQVRLEVNGDLGRPQELSARLFFEAMGLRYGTYVCEDLLAEAEYKAGLIDLTRLIIKDPTGQVNGSATWRMGTPDLRFQLTSSADLPGLAQAFLNSDNLREIVFYGTPHLALNGVWYVDGPMAQGKRPVQATGRLDCGRFSTRGAVFDGLEANIGVSPEGVYIRDMLLKHETGTLTAQALSHEAEGFRYRAVLRMDPNAFLPFAKMPQTREIISRFQFNPKSNIYFEVEGSGPKADLQLCLNKGRGDLRNFRYRGVDMEMMQADVEFQGPIQHYRNAKIQRAEGVGEVAHVHVDDKEKWVRLEGIRSKLDPVAVTSCFAPKVADIIAKYRLPKTTAVELDGLIYYKDPTRNDFNVSFRHSSGTGRYVLWGEDYLISAPQGELSFKGHDMKFDIRGRLFGEALSAKGRVDLAPGTNDFSVLVNAGEFPYEIFGKDLPFDQVKADVSSRGSTTYFDVKSSLLGGAFSLKGTLNERLQPQSYEGELMLDGVSFLRLTQIYSKTNDTEGDITGHFRFAGRMNDWMSLKGGGAATILNGNLYAVPILGPLTPILGSVLPGQIKGYNVAKAADCTFEVADGFIVTKNIEATTSVFRIAMGGKIDFIRDAVDLTAQVRIRGIPGLVFLPFSELLEYRGTGAISDTQWKSNLLSGNRKTTERAPPSAANMEEAERIARDSLPLKKEEPKKSGSIFNRPGGR
ncbi:AsmA-like protein [Prosthecobacter fusiformis]|uniref:AsmA-like protein n=1 Tax=Prosthecobacter fusiformis TaxID=48464 RepID=A0A4R7RLL3_9BACT|nr:AsmA-like C-terminal region-containing protein [Prosthecobacter fusiformis]TDU64555.1 AsmA-like protein [Prosthecobacter fusiformis]